MFNALNSQLSILFALFYAPSSCIVLLKKMWKGWFWVTMVILPCLVEGIAFASGHEAGKLRSGDKVFFECTVKHVEGITFSGDWKDFQGSKFILECFPQSSSGINASISVRNENSTRIGANNANDTTNNCSQKSSLSIGHFLLLAIVGGLIPTIILNLIIYFIYAQRKNSEAPGR